MRDTRINVAHVSNTAENTVISSNFLVWKFYGKAQFLAIRSKLWGNCVFPQNFHTRKLGEITVLYAVLEVEI